MIIHAHRLYDAVTGVVVLASVTKAALPTWDRFADYPRFQSAYKFVMIFLLSIASLDVRALIRPSIQSNGPQRDANGKVAT